MEYIKIVIDGYGGDNSPDEVVKGVKKSLDNLKNLKVVITGKKDVLSKVCDENQIDSARVEIIDASEVISNNESPTVAIRTKKDSSLVKALDILKNDDSVSGFVSAGSTGAVLTGGFLKVGRLEGVSRPALAPTLPTFAGTPVILIDCGANMDCKPINLLHFALMGSKYMQDMYGVKNPRVALLSVGVEDHKGNELNKTVFEYMKKLPINFVGNMEARELLSGEYDVVVADGFAGNVALKASEGALSGVMHSLKTDIKSHFWSKVGAVFMNGTFKRLKKGFDYSCYGGSPFLGVKKVMIKSHGASKAESFYQSIKQAYTLCQTNILQNISTSIKQIDFEIGEKNAND